MPQWFKPSLKPLLRGRDLFMLLGKPKKLKIYFPLSFKDGKCTELSIVKKLSRSEKRLSKFRPKLIKKNRTSLIEIQKN